MSARVVVVTRTRNRPVLLKRALSSVRNQLYTDFVLVIVNDGGAPAPVERLLAGLDEEFRSKVTVVHNETSVGREAAMNVGIDAAEGDYFVLHDDDDSWDPAFLSATTSYLESHPDDAAVATHTTVIHERIVGDSIIEVSRNDFASNLEQVSLTETLKQNYVPPIALLVRYSVFNELGRFDGRLPVLADWEFNLRLLSRHTVGFVSGPAMAFWHHRDDSTGDEGNSVVVEAGNHRYFNLQIRDEYLRRDLKADGGLGRLLLTAELVHQLDLKADAARTENSRVITEYHQTGEAHLQVVHADILLAIQHNKAQLEQIQEDLSAVVAKQDQLGQEIAIVGALGRVVRRVLAPLRSKSRRNRL